MALYQELRALPRRVRRALQRKLALSLAEIALLLALWAGPGWAATITVGASCTLINAITAANTDTATGGCPAGSGADSIVLPTGSTQTLTSVNTTTYGPAGLPLVTSTITIAGQGSTLQRMVGAPMFRLLTVAPGGRLTVHDLTLRGGETSYGGGLRNLGTLTLLRSTVSGNAAGMGGGGVLNQGPLTLTDSTVSGNTAGYAGGGVDNYRGTLTLSNSTVSGNTAATGGGVRNEHGTVLVTNSTLSGNTVTFSGSGLINRYGTLTMTHSMLTNNVAADGGGAQNLGGTVTLIASTLSGNMASDQGGGIRNIVGGLLTVTQSTLSGNTARYGGGVFNRYGTVTLANSLLSGNRASDNGGGVYNAYGSTVTMTQSTLSSNTARDAGGVRNSGTFVLTGSTLAQNVASNVAGGIDNGGTFTMTQSTLSGNTATYGGGGVFNSGSLVLTQSTLSGNVGGGVYNGGPGSTLTLARTLVSGNTGAGGREIKNLTSVTADNFNLFGHDGDAGVYGFTPVGSDLVPSQALSSILNTTLAFNGGPTRTQALVSGSPAVHAVSGGGCAATDQRGFVRNVGACDIGAVELGASTPPVVNSLVSFVPLPATFSTTTNTAGCPAGFAGKFFFQARLTNKNGSPSLTALKASVVSLSNTNQLQTADGGPGGAGAQQTLPQAGAFSDGVLAATETLDTPFVLCLKTLSRFQFTVNVLGLTP